MSKRCARCEKAVYPLEELKCLDKIWHKGCFKCQECNMTLSMKTYKGFNKLPYCEAHIPKAKATTVAETPEMRRLAENTKIQSNVQYHADFEKNKAKFTQVADDPETQRLKKNTQIISNVIYHGELAKKNEMERKRGEPDENEAGGITTREESKRMQEIPPSHMQQQQQQQQQYHHHHHHHHHQQPPPPQPQQQLPQQPPKQYQPPHTYPQQPQPPPQQPQQQQYNIPPPSNPQVRHPQSFLHHQQPSHQPPQKGQAPQYNPQAAPLSSPSSSTSNTTPYHHHHPQNPQNLFHDANHNSPYSARNSQTLIYSSQTGPVSQQPTRRVGSIADYDPVNEQYGSIATHNANPAQGYRQEATYQVQRSNLYGDQTMLPQQPQQQPLQHNNGQPPHHKVTAPPTQLGRCYRAMYDYEAADTDEVSFRDGDLIINCTAIDEGWMTGTIQRTGVTGMLPANYVERVS